MKLFLKVKYEEAFFEVKLWFYWGLCCGKKQRIEEM
jgi:hypothetical protein